MENAEDQIRIEVFVDDGTDPIVTQRPPARFNLDTTRLEDGAHTLHILAYDSSGQRGVRHVPFQVRNGPGISLNGMNDHDVLEGELPVLVNSYGGTSDADWEPSRVETPAPAPTWVWVLFIVIVAFAVFYGVRQWAPPPGMAESPTYSETALPR